MRKIRMYKLTDTKVSTNVFRVGFIKSSTMARSTGGPRLEQFQTDALLFIEYTNRLKHYYVFPMSDNEVLAFLQAESVGKAAYLLRGKHIAQYSEGTDRILRPAEGAGEELELL